MHVCDNIGDHLIGNVYARYEWEAEAQKAVDELNQRWYAGMYLCSFIITFVNSCLGRPLHCELSPVTDFRESCCRQNDTGDCNRGGFCNFMHLRRPARSLLHSLQHSQKLEMRLNPHGPMADEYRKQNEHDQLRKSGGSVNGSRRDRSRSPRR